MIVLKEAECCAPDAARTVVQHPCAGDRVRPQLKRDPLGGALPPYRHLFVNSFGTVITRGAELGCSQTSPGSPRPTPHGGAYGDAAPRPSFRRLAAHRQVLNPRRRGRPAARSAFGHRCKARRLTCAWSWRRPAASVEFHL